MKFKFCGDGDCPLWALAALHALGSLPAQLFRTLLHAACDNQNDDQAMEILKDTSLASREESARALATIRWVLQATWSRACPGSALARDLAVLGVPRAHAAALADAADRHRQGYVDGLAGGFAVNKLTDIAVCPATDADALKLTLHGETAAGQNRTELLIEKTQARDLLEQLKTAYKKMEELEGDQ